MKRWRRQRVSHRTKSRGDTRKYDADSLYLKGVCQYKATPSRVPENNPKSRITLSRRSDASVKAPIYKRDRIRQTTIQTNWPEQRVEAIRAAHAAFVQCREQLPAVLERCWGPYEGPPWPKVHLAIMWR